MNNRSKIQASIEKDFVLENILAYGYSIFMIIMIATNHNFIREQDYRFLTLSSATILITMGIKARNSISPIPIRILRDESLMLIIVSCITLSALSSLEIGVVALFNTVINVIAFTYWLKLPGRIMVAVKDYTIIPGIMTTLLFNLSFLPGNLGKLHQSMPNTGLLFKLIS